MLEAHPKEKAIVVNYKLEAAVYGDGDVVDPMLADKKVNIGDKAIKLTCLLAISQPNIVHACRPPLRRYLTLYEFI